MDTIGQALERWMGKSLPMIEPPKQPTGNVSNPLSNMRRDGQWDYRPVTRKRIATDTKSKP